MSRTLSLILVCAAVCTVSTIRAATIRVPQDQATVQAAIDVAEPGDVVLVAAGRYAERIRIKAGVTVRSAGDDAAGEKGMHRAEQTILDGGGAAGDQPGVMMGEGSALDGFTVTNVGQYQEDVWQQHFESQGETLGDDEGAAQAEGTIAAISIRAVNCTVVNNIVHHNGDVGIAVIGHPQQRAVPVVANNYCYRNLGGGIGVADDGQPIVRGNHCWENLRAGIGCRNASPLIIDNNCFQNIRAGIGCREGATPVLRGNRCYRNRRAGIGIRMPGTAPVVEYNQCYENSMAGIGNRDGAEPIIRHNECFQNQMAGIGCDGSKPLVVNNECRENAMAGIGLRGAAVATLQGNRCIENKLVAIGVTQGSTATIRNNHLLRTGGVPPIIAVKDDSTAWIQRNEIHGGGVAAILVQGTAECHDNKLLGAGEQQGNAVWVWEGSHAIVRRNAFDGYRAAVNATRAHVNIEGNSIRNFRGSAIVVKDSQSPAHVFGNTAFAKAAGDDVFQVQGSAGVVDQNAVRDDEQGNGSQ